ncbi:MAG TPA: hypothetical protein VFB15_10080 [Candidatus Binataceae bacterium]|jgi:hypothetical protein|nr:hypothetical protein [Candidatus Binataceae bacterium]
MVLIESDNPIADARLIDPCAECRREEGIYCVAWPDKPRYDFAPLCRRCLWRRLREMPSGPTRRALVRRLLGTRKPDEGRGGQGGERAE